MKVANRRLGIAPQRGSLDDAARSELVPHAPEEPTQLVQEPQPAEPYPLGSLGPLKGAADAIRDKTQAPAAIAAQAALGVAALAVQGLADVETLGGKAPCSLFLLTVAGSGERKSACDNLVMLAVREFEEELAAARTSEVTAAKNRRAIWEASRRRIVSEKADDKTDRAAREADLDALGNEPEEPRLPIVTTGDPTVEGLVKHMGQLRPSLGIFSGEGGAFLGGVGMNLENRLKTAAMLSSFWDGAPVTRLRAGDGGSSFSGRRLSMHLMVQPVAAAALLADRIANGQGLLARFLIVWPTSTIGTRTRFDYSSESDNALHGFGQRIGAILRQELRETSSGGIEPRLLRLSGEARAELEDFAEKVELAQAAGGELEGVRPFASKAAEHACRIAAVMTLYARSEAEMVEGGTMVDAIRIANFYLAEAQRLAGEAEVSAETSEAEQMRRWLVEKWEEPFISTSDATQVGPFKDGAKVHRTFGRLEACGWLVSMEGGASIRGKHRRTVWAVVRS